MAMDANEVAGKVRDRVILVFGDQLNAAEKQRINDMVFILVDEIFKEIVSDAEILVTNVDPGAGTAPGSVIA